MGNVTTSTNCDFQHPFNAANRSQCKAKKRCAGNCGPLRSVNLNLYQGCIEACQGSRKPRNAEDYKCNYVGAENLFNQYGMVECGFSFEQSTQYQSFQMTHSANLQNAASSKKTNLFLAGILGVVALIVAFKFW